MRENLDRFVEQLETNEDVHRAYDFLFRWRRKLATVAVAVIAAWMAFHVIFGANGMVVYQSKKAEYREAQTEVQSLQKENDRLNKEVDALRTDPKAVEKAAREEFGYARPGEVIYLLPRRQPNPPTTNSAQLK
ncbi:MAG TPA: septum formation initiator family protein [Terriglobales bacterium]|nr:septum formation initiator family protein [Terriglobales bacterium]